MNHPATPFHAGEQALQARAGMRDRMAQIGTVALRDHMPDQHREFYARLPFMVLGGLDRDDQPWATILSGPRGFVSTPDARGMDIAALPLAGDPLAGSIVPGSPVGLLGIELETRRRNRMNGMVDAADETGFCVEVGQSFGNCPQYIQAREHQFVETTPGAVTMEAGLLSSRATDMITAADTFFIASAAPDAREGKPAEGVDVSHRGGKPGFVRVTVEDGATVLTAPDFRGNFFFNTLGNLALNPRTGLLFVDFATGDMLHLSGEASVIWDGPQVAAFAGAERLLSVRVTGGAFRPAALPLRWSAPEQARQLAATGSWDQAGLAAS